jgi:hypothetical protein
MPLENYYEILGIGPSANDEEIKRAYRRLATLYHPDKVNHLGPKLREMAEAELKRLNVAKEFLLDPEAREKYNEDMGFEVWDVDEYEEGDVVDWEAPGEAAKKKIEEGDEGLNDIERRFTERVNIVCGACGYTNAHDNDWCHKCCVLLIEFSELDLSLHKRIHTLETKLMNMRLRPKNFFTAMNSLEHWYRTKMKGVRVRAMEVRIEELSEMLVNNEILPEDYFDVIARLRELWKEDKSEWDE